MLFDVLFGGSRFVARALGPALMLFAVCLPTFTEIPPSVEPPFLKLVAAELMIVLLAASIIWPVRLRWLARGFAGAAAIGWAALASSALARGITLGDVPQLVFSFLIWGYPGLAYAARGPARPADGSAPLEVPATDAQPTEPSSTTSMGDVFAAKLEWLLAANPHLRHEGEISSGRGAVWFPRADDAGFNVGVQLEPAEVVVHAELAHVHFPAGEDPVRAAGEALTCLTDLLGPDVRLRQRLAAGRPYLARLEMRTPEGWRLITGTALVFWNYLGRREERISQNRSLPGRIA